MLRVRCSSFCTVVRPRGVAASFAPFPYTCRHFCDGEPTPKWHARYPPRYFDFKEFRKSLREKKDSLSEAELREVRREYAPPPPEGWTVLTFLERMKFGDGEEDLAAIFERWEDFISMNPDDIKRLRDITMNQRNKLGRYIILFNHGLWPRVKPSEFEARFKGTPLEREGQPWSDEEDKKLLELAEYYDVNFGDPWLYLSWECQRPDHEVRDRYIDLAVRPLERQNLHEFALTKSSRPLLMNRKFRMVPPDLYVVPSEENFPMAPKRFELPAAFQQYRQADIF